MPKNNKTNTAIEARTAGYFRPACTCRPVAGFAAGNYLPEGLQKHLRAQEYRAARYTSGLGCYSIEEVKLVYFTTIMY